MTIEDLKKIREEMVEGDPMVIFIKLDSKNDMTGRKLVPVDGQVEVKCKNFFVVKYVIKGNVMRKSYNYQELMMEKPGVIRKSKIKLK